MLLTSNTFKLSKLISKVISFSSLGFKFTLSKPINTFLGLKIFDSLILAYISITSLVSIVPVFLTFTDTLILSLFSDTFKELYSK